MNALTPKDAMTVGRLKQLIRYEPDSGNFYWLVQRGPKKPGDIAGSLTSQGYRQLALDLRSLRSNRMAFLYMTGELPCGQIDHINGNRADDRWINLRDVTASTNQQNRRIPAAHNKSGLLGVFYLKRKQKWTARIRRKGVDYYIGSFETREMAQVAYIDMKRKIHEGCTL